MDPFEQIPGLVNEIQLAQDSLKSLSAKGLLSVEEEKTFRTLFSAMLFDKWQLAESLCAVSTEDYLSVVPCIAHRNGEHAFERKGTGWRECKCGLLDPAGVPKKEEELIAAVEGGKEPWQSLRGYRLGSKSRRKGK